MWMAIKVWSVWVQLFMKGEEQVGSCRRDSAQRDKPKEQEKNSSHQRGKRQERHRSGWSHAEVEAGSRPECLEQMMNGC